MKDLLKEAIADAKAVKETALANAKIALEEAFAPRLQSMLSAKLAEEMAEDEPEEGQPEPTDTTSDTTAAPAAVPVAAPAAGTAVPEDDTTPEGDGETNEGDEYGTETGEPGAEAPVEGDDDLDLDEIIRELEMDSASTEGAPEEEPVVDAAAKGTQTATEGAAPVAGETEAAPEGTTGDEDVNIDEIIKSLREDDESAEEKDEDEPKKEDLEEAYNVIRFLKGKINEVNMLNAKLLYSNKLFRNFSLNDKQKMTVIENFDRAHNLREVKLVYSTLAEGFKMPASKRTIKESFASKPVASTKPAKQVISEGADLANRFKKLAGLIK